MSMSNTLWGVNLGSSWGFFFFVPFLHAPFVWLEPCQPLPLVEQRSGKLQL